MRTPLLQKYDHCEFTDLVKKLLTQHWCLSKGHIHVIKAYPVCSQTLPVQVTFLWTFYGKEYLQIPACLALTTSFGHHWCSFVDPPLSLHILRYAECNTEPGVTCDSLFRLWKQQKKNTQSWKVKWFQDMECWQHIYIWQTFHDANANLENPASAQRTPGHRTEGRFI